MRKDELPAWMTGGEQQNQPMFSVALNEGCPLEEEAVQSYWEAGTYITPERNSNESH